MHLPVCRPVRPIGFNQFLIDDERPALIHTGIYPMYDEAHAAVPHFESDECGGMNRFAAEAPQAVLVCSAAGAAINLTGWD